MNEDRSGDPSQDPWNTNSWSAGVDSWWKAMATSRQVLQDLGDQVQSAVRGSQGSVKLADLQQIVTALGLVEERLGQSAEQGAALASRIDRVEAQVVALTEQVALVARTVSALGGHVESLASAQEPAPAQAAPAQPARTTQAAPAQPAPTQARPAPRSSVRKKPAPRRGSKASTK